MSHRLLGTGSLLAASIAVVSLATVSISGQAPASETKKKAETHASALRTAWGDPDLQGTWSYASLTPLERPAAMDGRAFFTPEEAAKREADTQVDAPPRPGDPGTYNALWFDRGKVDSKLRTSLIVDPPDGRLPLSPEGRKTTAALAERRRAHPADSWNDRSAWDRCITYHGVPPISNGYHNTYQIFKTPGYVAILDRKSVG